MNERIINTGNINNQQPQIWTDAWWNHEISRHKSESIKNLVHQISSFHTELTGNEVDFHYGHLPETDRMKIEEGLNRIQRGRTFNPENGTFNLPDEPYRETVLEHEHDMLKIAHGIQKNWKNLAQEINFPHVATEIMFHDSGEEGGHGDISRDLGEQTYDYLKAEARIYESNFFYETVLFRISRKDHREKIAEIYAGHEEATSNEALMVKIIDRWQSQHQIERTGRPNHINTRYNVIMDGFNYAEQLLNNLSSEAKQELIEYLDLEASSLGNAYLREQALSRLQSIKERYLVNSPVGTLRRNINE